MSSHATRVLITGDEETGTLALLRGLAAAGNRVWLAGTRPATYAARSRYVDGFVAVPKPSSDPRAFAQGVVAAARRLGAVAILPGTEAGLVAFARHEPGGSLGDIALGVPPAHVVDRATDKLALVELARAAGLAMPPTLRIRRSDLARESSTIGYPAIVKARRSKIETAEGTLHHGVALRVDTPGELLHAAELVGGEDILVQPVLPGQLVAVCGVSWDGRVIAAVQQAADRIWPPGCGVSSYARIEPPDPVLGAGAERLLAALGWSGLFQLQFMRVGRDARLIDLNPRAYGSLALAVHAGLNLPAIWLDLLLGRAPAAPRYRVGVRYRAEERDIRAIWAAVRAGGPVRLLDLLPRPRTAHAVFSWRDPGPALEVAAKIRRRLLARTAR
jgi:predicted ATP-grasp superfamily ATP-dependent carboligase